MRISISILMPIFGLLLLGTCQGQDPQEYEGGALHPHRAVSRVKRANSPIFDNSHIIHTNDANRLLSDPSLTAVRTQNMMNRIHAQDTKLRRDEWVRNTEKWNRNNPTQLRDLYNPPTRTTRRPRNGMSSRPRNGMSRQPEMVWENRNPIYQRDKHSLIVTDGKPKQVRNTFRRDHGRLGGSGVQNNVRESSTPHRVLNVKRDRAGAVNQISEYNSRIGAGLHRRNPVHFQPNYMGGSRPTGQRPAERTMWRRG